MTAGPLRLTVIVGSTRNGRAPTVAAWFAEQASARPDLDVSVIDVAETWLPDVLDHDGALTNAIDWFVDEWRAKPVGDVSYGGPSGGLRAELVRWGDALRRRRERTPYPGVAA